MRKSLLLLVFLAISTTLFSQQVFLSGKVTDFAGNPIAFASVYVKDAPVGIAANIAGQYRLKLKPGNYSLNFRAIGFKELVEIVDINGQNQVKDVRLHTEEYQSAPSTQSEDTAMGIIKNAIGTRKQHLYETEAYNCDVYIKGIQRLLHVSKNMFSKAVSKQLDIDTSTNNILYMYESESRLSFKQPKQYKQVVLSARSAGVNNSFNFDRAANLQVNFYRNTFDIEDLNQRRLISPLADDALKFYRYKLLGTTTENGKTIDKIQVTPIHRHGPVFNGNIYIVEGEWRIYSAHLFVTPKANLSYIDTLNINQQYIEVSNGKWQPASVTFTYGGNKFGFMYNGYIVGAFSNYDLTPTFPEHFFNGEIVRVTDETTNHDAGYWVENRPIPLTAEERRNYQVKDAILRRELTDAYQDSLQKADNKFKPFRYLLFGDTIRNRAKRSSWFFHPSYETILFNNVEGFALDLKADYNKQVSPLKSYTISPEVRYGFSSDLLSENVGFQYRYNPYTKAVFYGKIGSSVLDLNNEINNSPFINSISTLFFKSNTMKLYRSKYAMLGMQHNLVRGILFDGSLEYAQREQLYNTTNFSVVDKPEVPYTSNNPFRPELPDTARLFRTSNAMTLKASVTFAFDEQFTATPNGVFYEPNRLPKIKLTYKKGIKNVLNSDIDYDYGDVQVFQDHIKLGHIGYSSFTATAGKFFNISAMVYPDFKKFKGNEGITFTPLVSYFHFLKYYTYTTESFVEAHYEHNFSGFLLGKVKGVRELKLEEMVGANYLSRANAPGYMEFYIGLKRYIFRVDYGIAFMGGKQFMHGVMFYYGL